MVIILMADGFEEIEALTPADVLRRAGVAVTLASVSDSLNVTGSHGITVTCDTLASELSADGAELLIFPGGMPGAKNLDESADAERLLSEVLSSGGRVPLAEVFCHILFDEFLYFRI